MIYVAVALDAEARPLIAHFQLEKSDALDPLSVYRRSDLALIVAGVGKDSMASSVAALAKAIPSDESSAWLNMGVAGHRDYGIGTVVLAGQVTDEETGTLYQLSPLADLHLQTCEVRTVAHVETRYETEAVYDMEAAAFCQQTADLTSPELIQVLKIVSDNRRSGTLCVSAHQVQGLVEENLPRVDLVVSSLHRQARELSQ